VNVAGQEDMTMAHGSEGGRAPRVVVVGSTNVDLVVTTSRVPQRGETLVGEGFTSGFGGKGANQAVMARLAGADVTFVAALGDDANARITRENLASFGISDHWVDEIAATSSGIAQIWVEPDGANRIIIVPGANAALDPHRADDAVRTASPAVVVAQLEVPQPVSTAAFRAARDIGATTILNPAPAADLDPDLLAHTDWLIPNETEFTLLSEGGDPTQDEDLVRFASTADVRLAVTLGAGGVALVDGTHVLRLPAPAVRAVDTTGAGDAFVGAFAAALAAGVDVRAALKAGLVLASDSVTRIGAQTSYPSAATIGALLAGVASEHSDHHERPA
jgi:ribokinase